MTPMTRRTNTRTQPNPRGQVPHATRSPTPRARAAAAADQIRRDPGGGQHDDRQDASDGGGDDDEHWLAESIAGVQRNAFYMHRALWLQVLCRRGAVGDRAAGVVQQ